MDKPEKETAELGRGQGQVTFPAELRDEVSTHRLWKRGTTAMFDVQIVNIDAGSYLHMMPKKALSNLEKNKKGK